MKKKKEPAGAASPGAKKKGRKKDAPLPPARTAPRWRMELHPDGVNRAPVRVLSHKQQDRNQALLDMYGELPLPSVQDRLLPVSSVLAEVVSKLDLQETELAPELLADAWQRAVGDFLSIHAELVALEDGTASVRTSHPTVHFELQRHKAQIIRRLNAILGEGCVRSVQLFHG